MRASKRKVGSQSTRCRKQEPTAAICRVSCRRPAGAAASRLRSFNPTTLLIALLGCVITAGLSGCGVTEPGLTGGTLLISTQAVNFGNVTLNTPATQTVTLTSSGSAPLTISAGSVTGSEFSLVGADFPITLEPGQTATLNIQFEPTAMGPATGGVALATDASSDSATISLSGSGQTAGAYAVDLSWNAPKYSADPVAGYYIYRGVSGSPSYQLLDAGLIYATSYSDATVESGTAYTYYVVSVDASGNQSAPSNVFSVTIP